MCLGGDRANNLQPVLNCKYVPIFRRRREAMCLAEENGVIGHRLLQGHRRRAS